MSTTLWIRVLLGLATTLFAVEDLVGTANVVRLENAWLTWTDRAVSAVVRNFKLVRSLWPQLLGILVALVVHIGAYAGFWYLARRVGNRFPDLTSYWYGEAVVLLVFAAALLLLGFLIMGPSLDAALKLSHKAKADQDAQSTIEIQAALRLIPLEPLAYRRGDPALFSVLRLLLGTALVLATLIISTVVRGAILTGVATFATLLLPSRILRFIARRTGATSILKVGKYILTIIALVLSIVLAP